MKVGGGDEEGQPALLSPHGSDAEEDDERDEAPVEADSGNHHGLVVEARGLSAHYFKIESSERHLRLQIDMKIADTVSSARAFLE